MPELYPVLLNLSNKPCLVIGGGPIAARKINSLVAAGAIITVVSPDLCSGLNKLADDKVISYVPRRFEESDLAGAFLVVAATDDQAVNQQISQAVATRGILANVVDAPSSSTFIAPSVIRQGDLILAISTSGKSPALSRALRVWLEKEIGPEFGELVEIAGQVRSDLKQRGIRVTEEKWQGALNIDELIELTRKKQYREAKSMLTEALVRDFNDAA